jgi:hypothetical protein
MRKVGKKEKIITNQTLLATVDISKDKNTSYFRCPDDTEFQPFTFGNHRQGFTGITRNITKYYLNKIISCKNKN